MISLEIRNNLCQVEICTNCTETEFQAPAEFGGISRAEKNRNNTDEIRLDAEIDRVFVEHLNSGFAYRPTNELKSFGILQDALNSSVNFGFEPISQSQL